MKRAFSRETGPVLGWLLALFLAGCGAGSVPAPETSAGSATEAPPPDGDTAYAEAASAALDASTAEGVPAPGAPAPPPQKAPPTESPEPEEAAAARELLVYEAKLAIAVYQVERVKRPETQRNAVDAVSADSNAAASV